MSAAASAGSPAPAAAGSPTPPASDLLLVTIDTLRYDALGSSGNERVETPVLDRLAAAGRRFDNAHAHNVVTLPSHANILTGLYPYQHGVRENSGFVLGTDPPTLATLLAAAGFETAAFVAAYPLDSRFGLDRGFDVYDDSYPPGGTGGAFVIAERRGDEVVDGALDWWRARDGQKRFLWVHLYDPHAPYRPPEPFASRYASDPYLGEVAAVDRFLAPLLEPILASGGRGTLVAVTSDHGEALGDHGELTHGLFAYEATLKVPLLLWGQAVEPGVDRRPVGHVDLLPTLLAAAGVRAPAGLPGLSLLGPAGSGEDGEDAEPRKIYFEALSTYFNRGWAPLRGTLSGSDKWIDLPLPELYDLESDPLEADNRFERDRETATALRRSLPREQEWPPSRGEVSSSEAARLRSLGYVTGTAGGRTRFGPEDDPKRLVELDRKLHRVIDLYSRGELAEAAAVAREVVRERPDMAVAYEHLALVLRQLERPAEAIEVLESALARGIASRSISRELGLTLAETGRSREAIGVLSGLVSDDDPEALVALGNAYFAAGRLAEAKPAFEGALAADERTVEAYEGLGAVALAAGRPGDALRYLERGLALNNALPISWNSLGVARMQLGDPGGAMAAWQRSIELDPRQYDALLNFGLTAAGQGQAEAARQALARFVAVAPPARYANDLARARQVLAQLGGG